MAGPKVDGLVGLENLFNSAAKDIPLLQRAGAMKAARIVSRYVVREIRDKLHKSKFGLTGALSRRWTETFMAEHGKVVAVKSWSGGTTYAYVQDQGGTIFPRKRKLLAIPLNAQAGKRWPRDWQKGRKKKVGDLVAIPRKGKPPILCQIVGKEGKNGWRYKPQYALAKSVRIEGVHYVDSGWEKAKEEVYFLFPELVVSSLMAQK
jgi:hypothetical protein